MSITVADDDKTCGLTEPHGLLETLLRGTSLTTAAAAQSASVAELTKGVPTDNYVANGQEWQLTGAWGLQAQKVWGDYTGAGVLVADLDDGFQANHPDLQANYRTDLAYDFLDNDNDASPGASDNHGTSVLAEIIGDDNGAGIVGAAFDAQGFGIRMGFGSNSTMEQIQEGFQYALTKGAAVLNNSWGFTTNFSDDFGKVSGVSDFNGISAAMKAYADQDRNGLGGSIVFAAGNSRTAGDNTNFHNMTNSIYSTTVAAIDSNGHAATFSNPGTSILVSAGGVADLTADRTGTAGYVSGDYVSFSGTSAAAPVVSGLIALMLEANPNLGWRDIQTILAYSAQQNDPTSAGWQYNGASNWNGGGLHYSADYGFGAANAFTAIRLAETWTGTNDSANMLTVAGGSANPNANITGSTLTSTINVVQNIDVEHVLVNLNLTDTKLSGLTVTLIAPDGTHSLLIANPGNGTSGNYLQFQTMTNADWGEQSAGQWTLQVQDSVSGSTGILRGWSISFTGGAASANDTFFYTDDFAAFSGAALAARSVIGDGGNDTLNLACVTTASTIDLGSGTGTIGGHAVTIAAGTHIAAVYGGDGTDQLTVGATSCALYGGRGDDILTAGAGAATLDGGAGNDTVVFHDVYADFTFTFSGTSGVVALNTAGLVGTDTISNVENFTFNDQTLTYGQLLSLATPSSGNGGNTGSGSNGSSSSDNSSSSGSGNSSSGGNSASNDTSTGSGNSGNSGNSNAGNSGSVVPVALDTIGIVTPYGRATHTYASSTAETFTMTAADFGMRGTAGVLQVSRDPGTGLTLTYLSPAAPAALTLNAGGNGDAITVTGTTATSAPRLALTVNGGAGDDNIQILVPTTATVHGGDGNDVIAGLNSVDVFYGEGGDDIMSGGNSADKLYGGDGNDTLSGFGGNDILDGGAGNNIIDGGDGNDTITAGDGNNELHGGNGDDRITVGNGANTIFGDAGNDVIVAGGGGNTIDGGAGNNTITSGAGSDSITVASGANVIRSGDGNDTITAGDGRNVITAGNGANHITVGLGSNTIVGGNGGNAITAGNGANTITTGAGADTITVGAGSNVIRSGDGGDTIQTGDGRNVVIAGAGANHITTGAGADSITAGNGGNTIDAGAGNNTVVSGSGGDTITVAGGSNSIRSGDGNDTITAGDGRNAIIAGNGANNITVGLGSNTITAGNGGNTIQTGPGMVGNVVTTGFGNDSITTGNGSDVIRSGGGNDTIHAGDGNNVIIAGLGQDFIYAGSGNDSITAGAGGNTINAGDGANTVVSGNGDDTITTGSGNDRIMSGNGNDTIHAGDGNNIVSAGTGANHIDAGIGNDSITAGNGGNVIDAGDGNNSIVSGSGADTITAGAGNDVIRSGDGGDTIHAGDGHNTIIAGNGANFIYSGAGIDAITAGNGGNTIDAGDGNNSVTSGSGADTITTGSGNDVIRSGNGNDVIHTGDGNNTVIAGNGADVIVAGAGNDTIVAGNGGNSIDAGDGNNTVTSGGGNDTITGGAGNDILHGGAGNDTVTGGAGSNTLYGDAGDDILISSGHDVLYGGIGADTFRFTAIDPAGSIVADFSTAQNDRIDLSALLQNFDPASSAVSDFVQLTTVGRNTVVSVDQDPSANPGQFVTVATISNVTHLDVQSLIDHGNLVVHA